MKARIPFLRFLELDKTKINQDYHIHTRWTDGEHDVTEIIKHAEKLGLESIAFTEHIRQDSSYYDEFYTQLDVLRKEKKIQIFTGVETKVINLKGELDISLKDWQLAELVLGSVHSLPSKNGFLNPNQFPQEELFTNEYQLALAMIRKGQIDVLAHPGGMSILTYGEFPEKYLEDMIKRISNTPIAFEINSRYMTPEFLRAIARFSRQYNPRISLGSDVHSLSDLGKCKNMIGGIL